MASAVGDALGFDPELLSDVNTAVTEACNNVILHAYAGGPGPFSVDLRAEPAGVRVKVRDHGGGIRQSLPDSEGLKVGLALMSALADRSEFTNAADGGTEVRLSFRSPTNPTGEPWPARSEAGGTRSAGQAELHSSLTGDVVLSVSPVTLLAPVLGRIGRALAPSAGFFLQRCSDVYLISDVLGAHAERSAEAASISVALGAQHQQLDFALAPLRIGSSANADHARGTRGGDTLVQLAEEISFSAMDGHETLRVSMRDRLRA